MAASRPPAHRRHRAARRAGPHAGRCRKSGRDRAASSPAPRARGTLAGFGGRPRQVRSEHLAGPEGHRQAGEGGEEGPANLLHFHVGSQITSDPRGHAGRCARPLASHEGGRRRPLMCFFDAGGGLGVDYDGSRTTFHSSMNYTIREYAAEIVYALLERCEETGVSQPEITAQPSRPRPRRAPLPLVVEATDVVTGRRDADRRWKTKGWSRCRSCTAIQPAQLPRDPARGDRDARRGPRAIRARRHHPRAAPSPRGCFARCWPASRS